MDDLLLDRDPVLAGAEVSAGPEPEPEIELLIAAASAVHG